MRNCEKSKVCYAELGVGDGRPGSEEAGRGGIHLQEGSRREYRAIEMPTPRLSKT